MEIHSLGGFSEEGNTFIREFASAFQRLTEGYDDAVILGLGVHSDTDATGLIFAAQSRRGRDQQLAAYPDYPSDAIWGIGDWDIHFPAEDLGSGPEGRVNEAISVAGEKFGDDINSLRTHVWESAVEAMAALHQRGFFDRWPGSVRVFSVMDGSNDEREAYEWLTRCNDEDALRTLPAFLGIEHDDL